MCIKQAVKVEKHSKNNIPFFGSYSRPNIQTKSFAHSKVEATLREDKSKDKGKGLLKSSLRSLIVRDASNVKGVVTFKMTV